LAKSERQKFDMRTGAAIALSVLAILALVSWRPASNLWVELNRASSPQGLFNMALELHQPNPQLNAFSTHFSDGSVRSRLFGLTASEAHAALRACPVARWHKVDVVPPQYSDDPIFHIWKCDVGAVTVLGRVQWEPSWGLDGVVFSACRKSECLAPRQSFPVIPSQNQTLISEPL